MAKVKKDKIQHIVIPPLSQCTVYGSFTAHRVDENWNKDDEKYQHFTRLPAAYNDQRTYFNRGNSPLEVQIIWSDDVGHIDEPSPCEVPGQEHLDPLPHSLAITGNPPLSIHDEMKRFIRAELSAHYDERGEESFEDSEDFDVNDDDFDEFAGWSNHEINEMLSEELNSYDVAPDTPEPRSAEQDEDRTSEAKDKDSPPPVKTDA